MKGLWTRWVARLAHKEPATALGLWRVAVALCVVYAVLQPVVSGTLTPIWVDLAHGGLKPLQDGQWLVALLGGPTPTTAWTLVLTALGGAALLGLGLGARPAAFVTLQACLALFSLHPTSGGGHDRVLTNALWLLVFAPSAQTLSLACRWRTGRWTDTTPVAAWPRYLALVQLSVIYGMTGAQKLGSSWFPWGDYAAVYYALQTPSWARYDVDMMAILAARFYPLTQLGTAVTWLWELSFPVVLLAAWWRHTRDRPGRLRSLSNRLDLRWGYALVGIVMHSILFITMELGPFSLITLAYYLCLWHPDEWARGLRLGPSTAASDTRGGSGPEPQRTVSRGR